MKEFFLCEDMLNSSRIHINVNRVIVLMWDLYVSHFYACGNGFPEVTNNAISVHKYVSLSSIRLTLR